MSNIHNYFVDENVFLVYNPRNIINMRYATNMINETTTEYEQPEPGNIYILNIDTLDLILPQ